jgi:hypothetical protein
MFWHSVVRFGPKPVFPVYAIIPVRLNSPGSFTFAMG